MDFRYIESTLSREDKLIVRMGLLKRDYDELRNVIDSYHDKGILRKTLEYLNIIEKPEEPLRIRAYRKAAEVCENVQDLTSQKGLVKKISRRV